MRGLDAGMTRCRRCVGPESSGFCSSSIDNILYEVASIVVWWWGRGPSRKAADRKTRGCRRASRAALYAGFPERSPARQVVLDLRPVPGVSLSVTNVVGHRRGVDGVIAGLAHWPSFSRSGLGRVERLDHAIGLPARGGLHRSRGSRAVVALRLSVRDADLGDHVSASGNLSYDGLMDSPRRPDGLVLAIGRRSPSVEVQRFGRGHGVGQASRWGSRRREGL